MIAFGARRGWAWWVLVALCVVAPATALVAGGLNDAAGWATVLALPLTALTVVYALGERGHPVDPVGLVAVRRPWMAPPVDRMVERPGLAEELVAALTGPEAAEVGLTTGLHGAGGFGKTTLAAWVCHQPLIAARFSGGLLWVSLGQEVQGPELAERVNDLAWVLSGRRPAISDPDTAGAELGLLLDQQGGPVLMVVDDVWTEAQLRAFRFGGRSCTRLITTRIGGLLPAGAQVVVDAMSRQQAKALVSHGVPALSPAAAEELADLAGRWPVLLNLLNGVLRRRVDRGQPVVAAAAEVTRMLLTHGPAAFDPLRSELRHQAVEATMEVSLRLLPAEDRDRYLDLAIFPEDVDIPVEVLELLWPGARVDLLCEELTRLGLASYRLDAPGPRLALHDVIRAYVRTRCGGEARTAGHRRLVAGAAEQLVPGDAGAKRWWQLPREPAYLWRYLPHHLRQAGADQELATLVTDLRWVHAKTRRFGSVVAAAADLALVDDATAQRLRHVLEHDARLLGPIDPPQALAATLASRLSGVEGLQDVAERYRPELPRPRLEPVWPLPDRAGQTETSTVPRGVWTSCAWSPDGALLATGSDDGTATVWSVADGIERAVLTGHAGGVWDCAFSPDGQVLATTSDDRTVRLWRVADGVILHLLVGHTDWVHRCAFSPDGALLATTGSDGTTRLWRTSDAEEVRVLLGHAGGATGCAFSPDGALLATTGDDGTTRIWQVDDGDQLAMLSGHTGRVRSCAFSPDGALLATAGDDGTTRIWPVGATAASSVLVTGHPTWTCAFSPDSASLATSGLDSSVRLWDVGSGALLRALPGHGGWARGCVFSPDGQSLATAGVDQVIRLWPISDNLPARVLGESPRWVNGCAFSPDGTVLATVGYDRTARWRHLPDGDPETVLIGHTSQVNRAAFSPDGSLFATTSSDCTVRLWRRPEGTEHAVLTGHTGGTRDCAFSPDGVTLATTSHDHTVRLWDVATGALRQVLSGHAGSVGGCAFSPDGTLLATSSTDHTTVLWDAATGVRRAVLTGHEDTVVGCEFSPDGGRLATVSDDRTVRLWRLPDGEPEAVLTGHTSWVEACAFSPDGQLLVSAGRDHTVRVWHLQSRQCQCALRVAGSHSRVAWHPHGELICATGAGIYLLRYIPPDGTAGNVP